MAESVNPAPSLIQGLTHNQRVRKMMEGFGQSTPTRPALPTEFDMRTRSKLTAEEAFEFIDACGLQIVVRAYDQHGEPHELVLGKFVAKDLLGEAAKYGDYSLTSNGKGADLVEVADAIGDISVINNGNAITFGIDIDPVLELIDENNMLKIATGHKDPDTGKFIKHPNHPKVDLVSEIARQQLA